MRLVKVSATVAADDAALWQIADHLCGNAVTCGTQFWLQEVPDRALHDLDTMKDAIARQRIAVAWTNHRTQHRSLTRTKGERR